MNDRELLEMAAKAAGYEWDKAIAEHRAQSGLIGLWIPSVSTCWNPLADEGDALRLAVKLELLIDTQYGNSSCITGDGIGATEMHSNDKYAATRRAIVRAAAEIGKAMP